MGERRSSAGFLHDLEDLGRHARPVDFVFQTRVSGEELAAKVGDRVGEALAAPREGRRRTARRPLRTRGSPKAPRTAVGANGRTKSRGSRGRCLRKGSRKSGGRGLGVAPAASCRFYNLPRKRTNAPSAAPSAAPRLSAGRSEEHTSELQSRQYLVCRL